MKRQWIWLCGFTAVFAAAMAYVFWGTWSPDVAFVQPDSAVTYPVDFFSRKWHEFCGGGSLVPWELRYAFGGPYVWQELQYAAAMYLAALGVVYYLKGRCLPPLACYGAGMAYGFMGYNFTLYSAGHLGWFELLMCAPFCFGLIDRCVRKGRWLNWVLLGGLLAWGGVHQPDIWLLFTMFLFAYGVFSLLYAVLAERDAAGRGRIAARVFLGVLVTSVMLVASGWSHLHNAVFVQTANRDRQIAQSIGADQNAAKGNDASSAAEREKRYVFCTNWSLPPDETIEFLLPDVNGGSSDARVTPGNRYRGRIGMQVAPGRWAPYRQHSLYMGFITVCLALLGVFAAFRVRRGEGTVASARPGNRAEMLFWSFSSVVILLLSFGGFTPFYRLVFELPMGDYIRCPVKFVHLLEWCVAVLAGYGIAWLLSLRASRKMPMAASAALGALLFVNVLNLVVEDAEYCAVDPGDTIRIAMAKETGSQSLGFVMDANARFGEEEYLFAGGSAFRDNKRLKDALSNGAYAPVSFWNFQGGRIVKTARERAGFALLKSSRPHALQSSGSSVPNVTAMISMLASFLACLAGVVKLIRRRAA